MLLRLTIRDIVLIERLELEFAAGLTVLTGETGAGKSILLDALGLVLGARADSSLVRQGAAQAVVSAEFAVAANHPANDILTDLGWPAETRRVLRRVVGSDGRSRAFVDDQPASVGLLGQVGAALVETHGQHDDRGLLNTAGHRALLDAFGRHDALAEAVSHSHDAVAAAAAAYAAAEAEAAEARKDEDYLRHVTAELAALSPEPGEEARLAAERHALVEGERAEGELGEIATLLGEQGGVETRLRTAQRRLERLAGRLQGVLDPALLALERAALEAEEAVAAVAAAQARIARNPARVDSVEERLFALRAAARKHQVSADDLPGVAVALSTRLAAIDGGSDRLARLAADLARAEGRRAGAVARLTAARQQAAARLDAGVNAELEALKLGRARFRTLIEPLAEAHWGPDGGERVSFEVSTNPGAPFGPLLKIASGGELARFILALKVVLAGTGSAPTLVFDEVDRGIGGAVADAVGDRLARLSARAQILVVTHSPQVAARGRHHLGISKHEIDNVTRTEVVVLPEAVRREEIARMLAGAEITQAARAAADALLKAAR